MTKHFVTYRKRQPERDIWLEFGIGAKNGLEARLIAEKEIAALRGYRFIGSN